MELWKVDQVGFGKDDLFEAIITAEEGTKLIAQVTTMSVANDIVEDHNRRIIKCVCCAANSKWFKFCPDCGRFLQPVCTCDKPQKGEMVDGFYCENCGMPWIEQHKAQTRLTPLALDAALWVCQNCGEASEVSSQQCSVCNTPRQ